MFKSHAPIIAVGSDDSNSTGPKVLVYEFSETGRRWIRVESIMTINDAVHDIAFAPNIGRSYFVLAVATNKDLRIISMKNAEDGTKSDQPSKYQVKAINIVHLKNGIIGFPLKSANIQSHFN